jgi:autotransporter strand-loop-strand O-heptosyltransferase
MKTKIFFKAGGLGDSIGWMGQVERYQKATGDQVDVFCKFNDIFGAKNINIYPKNSPLIDDTYDQSFVIDYHGWERPPHLTNEVKDIKEGGLIQMASEILGFEEIHEVKPILKLKFKNIKLKRPTVSMASLSTMQQRLWTLKGGWNKVISYLKQRRIDVVSLDHYTQFGAGISSGDIPAYTPIPSASKNKTGFPLRTVASYINKSLFFMGLSGGLSWLAWALNQPAVMVVGPISERYHFKNPYIVQNKNVCHACWDNHDMKADDWYWCPENKDFECTRLITPEMVIEKINLILKTNEN